MAAACWLLAGEAAATRAHGWRLNADASAALARRCNTANTPEYRRTCTPTAAGR
ncbi:MAG: hypothetical protein U1E47_08720 [Rivihabitans pingtungensis]